MISDNHQDAVEYCARQRPVTPPVYNEARINEQPVPNTNPPIIADESIAGPSKDRSNNQEICPCNVVIEPMENTEQSRIVCSTASSNNAVIDENDEQPTTSNNFEEVLVEKFDPSEVEIKEEDPLELMNDFEDESEQNDEPSFFYEVVSDEVVMFYENKSSFKPMATNLRFKIDDVLSGALPFKEYVSFEMQNHFSLPYFTNYTIF